VGDGIPNNPSYVSRLLLDCVPVFHKVITPAYLLYGSGPVAIYYSEIYSLFYGGRRAQNYSYATGGIPASVLPLPSSSLFLSLPFPLQVFL